MIVPLCKVTVQTISGHGLPRLEGVEELTSVVTINAQGLHVQHLCLTDQGKKILTSTLQNLMETFPDKWMLLLQQKGA